MDFATLGLMATSVLTPFLTKMGEKVVETIAERATNKTLDAGLWTRFKNLFKKGQNQNAALVQTLEAIESKPTVSPSEIKLLETQIVTALEEDNTLAPDLQTILNITPANEFLIQNALESIKRLQDQINKLTKQMERAGIATEGDYQNALENAQEKLYYQQEALKKSLGF